MLLEALRLLQRLRSYFERALLLHSLRWLQWRNVLERMAQRSAALPGSVQLPRRLDRTWLLSELRTMQRCLRLCRCIELSMQLERICGSRARPQYRHEPRGDRSKQSASSIATGACRFAACEPSASKLERTS